MTATIIDGKAIAAEVLADLAEQLAELRGQGVVPGLATILVGDDPASATYVRNKHRKARELGLFSVEHTLPHNAPAQDVYDLIDQLNADPRIDGILVQLPLPPQIDPLQVVSRVDPLKDVDGLHPVNALLLAAGQPRLVPCTPAGCVRLLDAIGVSLSGQHAVVIGRSGLVGRPLAQLLLARHCTVTQCHSRTRDLPSVVALGDVVVAAVGKPGLVRGSWFKPGAVVIDVGTSKGADGKLAGDVEFAAAAERVAAITPVPGGVGPMTIAMLMVNTVHAAKLRRR